jgi:hypothetical protein
MHRLRLVFAVLVVSATHAGASTRSCSCTPGDTSLVLASAGLALACIVAVILGVASYVRRVRARDGAVAEPISLLVAERLARAVQLRAGVVATVGLVGVPTLVIMKTAPLAILSTIIGCIGVRGYFIAHAVLQLIERGGDQVAAEAVGPTIVVRGTGDEAQLEVSVDALARARRHAVPRSIAKRP